jgi:hypothetical protein
MTTDTSFAVFPIDVAFVDAALHITERAIIAHERRPAAARQCLNLLMLEGSVDFTYHQISGEPKLSLILPPDVVQQIPLLHDVSQATSADNEEKVRKKLKSATGISVKGSAVGKCFSVAAPSSVWGLVSLAIIIKCGVDYATWFFENESDALLPADTLLVRSLTSFALQRTAPHFREGFGTIVSVFLLHYIIQLYLGC